MNSSNGINEFSIFAFAARLYELAQVFGIAEKEMIGRTANIPAVRFGRKQPPHFLANKFTIAALRCNLTLQGFGGSLQTLPDCASTLVFAVFGINHFADFVRDD